MSNRRTILACLFLILVIGGVTDVLFYDPREGLSPFDFILYIPIAVLTWLWIRTDLKRKGKPMYSTGFTWVLALIMPVAFAYHAFMSRKLAPALILLVSATAFAILSTLIGSTLAIWIWPLLPQG